MTKTLFLLLILISNFVAPAARADFEADLADTGNVEYIQMVRDLRVRAEAGDADAQLNLGGAYFKGQGVNRDYAEATKWFLMAAQQGQSLAQFNLGMMYATGEGVAQDHAEAAKWYRASANQGLGVAQLNLGVAYATGQGVLQNDSEAVKWLKLAATQGEAQAQFNLGVMYANGQGVRQDLVESYRWAKLADAQGHETAKALVADLSKKMTPEQVRTAENGTRDDKARNDSASSEATSVESAQITDTNAEIASGYYLQLAALKSQQEAQTFLEQIQQKRGNVGKPISIYTTPNWIRVHVGPYDDKAQAQRNATQLKDKLGITPLLKRY